MAADWKPADEPNLAEFGVDVEIEMRFLIPGWAVGAIIGKQGATIRALRDRYNCEIHIPNAKQPDAVLVIAGEPDCAFKAVSELLQMMHNDNKMPVSDFAGELRLLVHGDMLGGIIGRDGANLQGIEQAQQVKIQIYDECCPGSTERVMQICSTVSSMAVVNAVKRILLTCARQRSHSRPLLYHPQHYDALTANVYGGYPPVAHLDQKANQHNPNYYTSVNHYQHHPPQPNYPSTSAAAPQKSAKLTVPETLIGVIVGRNGATIRQVMMDSGAEVKVSDISQPSTWAGALPTDQERIISIAGTEKNVQAAEYLLQRIVATSSAGREYLKDCQDRLRHRQGAPSMDPQKLAADYKAMMQGGQSIPQ